MVDVGVFDSNVERYHRLVQELSTLKQALQLADNGVQKKNIISQISKTNSDLSKARISLQQQEA